MEDIEIIYNFLMSIDFDGFQFKNSEGKVYDTISDSKLFTQSHYNSFKSAKTDRLRESQYNALKEVYDHFKK